MKLFEHSYPVPFKLAKHILVAKLRLGINLINEFETNVVEKNNFLLSPLRATSFFHYIATNSFYDICYVGTIQETLVQSLIAPYWTQVIFVHCKCLFKVCLRRFEWISYSLSRVVVFFLKDTWWYVRTNDT